jgi:hypothetical protein
LLSQVKVAQKVEGWKSYGKTPQGRQTKICFSGSSLTLFHSKQEIVSAWSIE